MDWGDTPVRIFIAGITLLAVCSSLLGVLTGWWLRGREVQVLRDGVRYFKGELNRYSEQRGVEYKLADECGVRYFGPRRDDNGWMKCQRRPGHYTEEGTKHGYAGVFWGEGKR
jgi:hypothetical protein